MSSTATSPVPAAIPDFAGERVTHSLLRYFEHPTGRTFALITIDNGEDHTKPSTFGPAGLRSLASAIDEAAASDADAIAVTGKPFWFLAGFDLGVVQQAGPDAPVRTIPEYGHAVYRRLGECGKPTFAFVNGAAMGGGVELALHCDYRTISSGVTAFALPEVFLGLIPGWGGAYLLPNLIGAEKALQVIVSNPLANNRMLRAKDVFGLGIADAIFEPADFLERSIEWAAGVLDGSVAVERSEPDRGEGWANAVNSARSMVDAKLHGAARAPYLALDLVEAARTTDRDTGFRAEDDALEILAKGDELRAGLYAFDLVQKRAKRPAGAPERGLARTVTKTGVVGAGLMASQLALLFAQRLQVPVVLTDLDQARIEQGLAYVREEIDKLLLRGRLSQDGANRLKGLVTGSTDRTVFADADLVIEAVFEEMKVKQQVFRELETVVSPDCVLATNTSSLSVTEMAAVLEHPERVVGMHFFNPVSVMPLLEIVRGKSTDEASLATAFATGKTLKKSCVLVQDDTAFVANRLLVRLLGEIIATIDEGADIEVADRALEPLGLPMSPLVLLQLVGPAIALHVTESLHEAFPDRFQVSENLRRLVAAGKDAVWVQSGSDMHVDPEVAALLQQGPTRHSAEAIRDRALAAIAEEIRLMLDDGVVVAAQDIDLCMLLGAGWPFHLGGITPYLDRTGISERVNGRRFLDPGVASVPVAD